MCHQSWICGKEECKQRSYVLRLPLGIQHCLVVQQLEHPELRSFSVKHADSPVVVLTAGLVRGAEIQAMLM